MRQVVLLEDFGSPLRQLLALRGVLVDAHRGRQQLVAAHPDHPADSLDVAAVEPGLRERVVPRLRVGDVAVNERPVDVEQDAADGHRLDVAVTDSSSRGLTSPTKRSSVSRSYGAGTSM